MNKINLLYDEKFNVENLKEVILFFVDEEKLNSENIEINIPSINQKLNFKDKKELKRNIPLGYQKYLKIILLKQNSQEQILNEISKIVNNCLKESFQQLTIINNGINFEKNIYKLILDGLYLGTYNFNFYKEKKEENEININLVGFDSQAIEKFKDERSLIYDSVKLARDLGNYPPDYLKPKKFVEISVQYFEQLNANYKIYDYKQLTKLGFNGIATVGKGSKNKPYFIEAHYNGNPQSNKYFALVGKGVTYDAGGLSIKPTNHMVEMKGDMAGAAVSLATFICIIKLNLPINLSLYIPLVENVISGESYKPSDIIKTYNNKTVEVLNTDAEGRLILADALAYASEKNPELIIDLATLTGAVVTALGLGYAGIFSNDNDFLQQILEISKQTNEKLWHLPLPDEYKQLLESDIADLKNLGGSWGGAITAALFLKNFINKNQKWIHIDIAGPSFPNEFGPNTQKTMTGFGVRLLVDFFQNISMR